jgi:hypothetical protein
MTWPITIFAGTSARRLECCFNSKPGCSRRSHGSPDHGRPAWDTLSPGDKQAWLLDQALDRKREILTMPLPDDGDDSIEATRLRALILAAADSTISQTIQLRSGALASPARDTRDQELEQIIEERRQQAALMIEKMREEPLPMDAAEKPWEGSGTA